jgi:hypothetical protein
MGFWNVVSGSRHVVSPRRIVACARPSFAALFRSAPGAYGNRMRRRLGDVSVCEALEPVTSFFRPRSAPGTEARSAI